MLQSMGSQRVGHDLVTEQQHRRNLQVRGEKKVNHQIIYQPYFSLRRRANCRKSKGEAWWRISLLILYFQEV